MAEPSEIKKAIRDIVGISPNLPVTGKVKSVEGDSCTVELKNGLSVSDVKLKATIGPSTGSGQAGDYLILTPKAGTKVVMLSQSGETNNFVVIKADEIEKVEYKQDGLNILIDSTDGKVSVKNGETSLVTIMNDLAALLKQLKVSTPNGPSGTPLPPTIQAITKFEQNVDKILK